MVVGFLVLADPVVDKVFHLVETNTFRPLGRRVVPDRKMWIESDRGEAVDKTWVMDKQGYMKETEIRKVVSSNISTG